MVCSEKCNQASRSKQEKCDKMVLGRKSGGKNGSTSFAVIVFCLLAQFSLFTIKQCHAASTSSSDSDSRIFLRRNPNYHQRQQIVRQPSHPQQSRHQFRDQIARSVPASTTLLDKRMATLRPQFPLPSVRFSRPVNSKTAAYPAYAPAGNNVAPVPSPTYSYQTPLQTPYSNSYYYVNPFKASSSQQPSSSTSSRFQPIQPKKSSRQPAQTTGYTLVQSPNGYTIQQTFTGNPRQPQNVGFTNPQSGLQNPQSGLQNPQPAVANPQQGFVQNPALQRGFEPSTQRIQPRPNPNPNPYPEQESVAQDRIDYDEDYYDIPFLDYNNVAPPNGGIEGEFFVPPHFKVYDAVPLI